MSYERNLIPTQVYLTYYCSFDAIKVFLTLEGAREDLIENPLRSMKIINITDGNLYFGNKMDEMFDSAKAPGREPTLLNQATSVG